MRAIAVVCIVLAAPLTILAWAVAPTIRDTPALAGALAAGVVISAVAVGVLLADALGDGLAAWGAVRATGAGRGASAAGDVIDLQARLARVELDRARTDDTRARTPTAPPLLGAPAPTFGGDVMYVGEVDA